MSSWRNAGQRGQRQHTGGWVETSNLWGVGALATRLRSGVRTGSEVLSAAQNYYHVFDSDSDLERVIYVVLGILLPYTSFAFFLWLFQSFYCPRGSIETPCQQLEPECRKVVRNCRCNTYVHIDTVARTVGEVVDISLGGNIFCSML